MWCEFQSDWIIVPAGGAWAILIVTKVETPAVNYRIKEPEGTSRVRSVTLPLWRAGVWCGRW